MSIQRLGNTITAAQVGALLENTQKAKKALETSIYQYAEVRRESLEGNWSDCWGSLQRERSLQYRVFQKANNIHDLEEKYLKLAKLIIRNQNLCTRFRATPQRHFRLIESIEKYCDCSYLSKNLNVPPKILDITESTKVNFPKTSEEVRSNIECLLESIKPNILDCLGKCISQLESAHVGLLKEEEENISLNELRVFLRNPKCLAVQKVNQKMYFIFTEHFFYSKNLIETLVSRFCRDPDFSQVDKSTLFTREKLLTVMMIKTLFGNQDLHRTLANRPREASLVPAVQGWTKEFNFVATPEILLQSIQTCKQRVENFDLTVIEDEEELIVKVMRGEEQNLPHAVRGFIADIKILVKAHAFNHNKIFSSLLTDHAASAYYPFLGDYENFILNTVVNHFLKDLQSPIKQKIEESKILLSQEVSQANLDALLKILVDLYIAGYGLELKNSILPLFLEEKHYPSIHSFIEIFLRCDNYYEAYELCLQLPHQEQKEILIAQCLQKLKEGSEALLKKNYCWIDHDFLLRNIVDFYINGKEQKIEASISCLFSHAFSSEALRAMKRFFVQAGDVRCYERFCSRFPRSLVPGQGAN